MNEDLLFKALSDPTRRLILDEFTQRRTQTLYELCARLITKHHVAISRQALTKHIDILAAAGLLRSQHQGKYRILTIDKMPIIGIAERWVKDM